MSSDTIVKEKPIVDDGSTTKKFKRHIVKREHEKGPLKNETLCGELWDRAHPPTGDICKKCIEIYKRLNPGMSIPTI